MGRVARPDRTLVMGIVNVTPDSFSDGGECATPQAAIARGLELAAEGADLIDIGGESTRPGAGRVELAEELRRVLPVVRALVAACVPVSVDTTRAEVAEAALEAGAEWINDVSGGLADSRMLSTVARLGGGYIAMHWRGHSADMQDRAGYADVVAEVVAELAGRRDAALAAGIASDRLLLDPGLGFAKTAEHNWALLRRLDALAELGQPVLLGASRKAFLGTLLAGETGPRPPRQRDAATTALTVLAAQQGLWGVRVHDARSSADAIAVVERMRS